MGRRVLCLLAFIAVLLPSLAWGLGADHPNRPIGKGDWSPGLAELINADNRVHGYFVNSEDVLFFRGDMPALNTFLDKYSKLPDTELVLIIHPGKLEVKSPWDQKPRDIVANWELYAAPFERLGEKKEKPADGKPGLFVTRVDLWLGDSLKLSELRVPKNVTVKSGGEIEAFVKEHSTKQP